MIQFMDKNGRTVKVTAQFETNTEVVMRSSQSAEEILLAILHKAPENEFIEIPYKSAD